MMKKGCGAGSVGAKIATAKKALAFGRSNSKTPGKWRAILFSTHITSDLDKCATNITYIHDGEIIYTGQKKDFVNSYAFVIDKSKNHDLEKEYIAFKELDDYIEGLIDINNKDIFLKNNIEVKEPDLEQIMVYLERSKNHESFNL